VAVTTLRPSGMARIEGVKYSVVTGGELIEKNQPVRVVKVEGSRIVVKKLSKI
jgi:membrane-bound serine protease (ClpP class)